MGARKSPVRKVRRGTQLHWVIDFLYVDKDGKRQRYRRDAAVQTLDGAHAEARRLIARLAVKGTLDVQPAGETLSAFAKGDFEGIHLPQYRPSTRERYKAMLDQGLLHELGNIPLEELDTRTIASYKATLLRRGVQDRPHLNLLRTILAAAIELGALDKLPAFPKATPKGRKFADAPSLDEVAAMFAAATGWLRVAIAMAIFAGLRQGEVRALEVRDIDFARDRLLIRRTLSGQENAVLPPKSGHDRPVPLAPELKEILRDAVRDKLPAARVITNNRGMTPSRQLVLSRFKALQAQHGLPARSFHQLRHFFCSTLVQRGVNPEVVRVLAGHSSLMVTERYLHAASGEFSAAISKLSGNGVVTKLPSR